jgi:hypothetical protein
VGLWSGVFNLVLFVFKGVEGSLICRKVACDICLFLLPFFDLLFCSMGWRLWCLVLERLFSLLFYCWCFCFFYLSSLPLPLTTTCLLDLILFYVHRCELCGLFWRIFSAFLLVFVRCFCFDLHLCLFDGCFTLLLLTEFIDATAAVDCCLFGYECA